MSDEWKTALSRRPLLAALGALVGIGVVGGAVYEGGHVLFRSAPKGPYGDLLVGLGDADTAARVGRVAMTGMPGFRASAVAGRLRGRLAGKPLAAVLMQDASEGRIDEVEDWVLPRTLAELCALAASQ
jgi:hypothetical protein